MNLFQQLTVAAKCADPKRDKSDGFKRIQLLGSTSTHEAAKARYSDALKTWTSTTDLRKKLCMSECSGSTGLYRYLKAGLVERRPRGGKYITRLGWEWRWVK